MFGKTRSEFQSLKRYVRILMFEKIRREYQCLHRIGQNTNVWKDKTRSPMFGKITPEFQSLER